MDLTKYGAAMLHMQECGRLMDLTKYGAAMLHMRGRESGKHASYAVDATAAGMLHMP